MQVLFLGLDNAGKTSIKVYLETLNSEAAVKTKISNGVEVYKKGDLVMRIIPGQAALRMNEKFYRLYFPSADLIVFVVDAADKTRFDKAVDYWRFVRDKILEYGKEGIRVIFLAHKQDLDSALSAGEIEKLFEGLLEEVDPVFLETSIFDYSSMVNLLNVIHNARKVGIDGLLEDLRKRLEADIAFLYDRHLLPISIAIRKKPNKELFDRISSVIVETEKLGEVHALILFFNDGSNLLVLGKRLPEERILVGAYNIRRGLSEAVKLFEGLYNQYREVYRKRLWASW